MPVALGAERVHNIALTMKFQQFIETLFYVSFWHARQTPVRRIGDEVHL
jgi:hypothetical protein